jgi:hypothetical protein
MAMHPVPPIIKKLAWGAGILLALLLTAHILLPFVVNASALRLRILSQVVDRVGGEADFQELKPVLLPLPHAIVTQGRIDSPGMFSISFAKGVVYPQFWPLLTGRMKIGRLKVIEPDIVIPGPTEPLLSWQRSQDGSLAGMDRRIHEALTKVAGVLSPVVVRIEGGRLTLTRVAQASITFTGIRIKARVSDEELSLWIIGRSSLMEAFGLQGRITLGSLILNGRIQLSGLDTARLVSLGLMPPEVPMPEMSADLTMNFETRGVDDFHCEYKIQTPQMVIYNGSRRLTVRNLLLRGEGRRTAQKLQLSLVQLQTAEPGVLLSGTAIWPAADRFSWMPAEVALKAVDLDVIPIRTAALELAGDEQAVRHLFDIIHGGRIPELDVRISGIGEGSPKAWADVGIQGRLSGGRIVLPHDLLHLEQVDGRVVMDKGRLAAEDVSARFGNSFAQGGTLVLGLFDGTRDFSLDAAIDMDLSEVPAVLKKLVGSRQIVNLLDSIPEVKGRAAGRLRLGDSLDHITTKVSTSGRMDALDASLDISGNIDAMPSGSPDFRLSLQGSLGPRLVAWLYDWGGLPADLLPRAPITVNHARFTRNRAEGLGLAGRFSLSDGLQIKAGLQIGPDENLSGKLHLQDAESNAAIDYQQRRKTGGWQFGFAGNLEKSTVDKLLRRNALILGRLNGDLRIRLQDGAPQHNTVQGRLDFRQIDTPAGFPVPLRLLSGGVAGNGARFELSSVVLQWEDSIARLSGTGVFAPEALNLDLALGADSLDADKLMQRFVQTKKDPGTQPSNRITAPPIRGRIRVDAGLMTLKGYRFTPIQAVATLGDGNVSVELTDAGLCGIAIPGQIRFDQDGVWMLLKPHAAGSALRDTDQCLAGTSITERLEGTVSVDGSIESRGQSGEELAHNLEGRLDVQIADGRIYNVGAAGFFTNLLSFLSINQLIEGGMPDLRRNDFRYKSLTSKFLFKEGVVHIEEGVLRSNSVNIVASGEYGMAVKKMNLVLLVSPLTTVDWIIERIPLLGNILQGTLVAIPVGVKGPAANPTVVPLSPTAVGSRLGGILKRTLKTPFRILSPLLKDKPKDQGRYRLKSSSAV